VINCPKITEVVAAIIMQPDGRFLLARRPHGKTYAGYWEFPGGKVEFGESLFSALNRELLEELGIHVELAYPWISRVFTRTDKILRLYFYRVVKWHGEPQACENQELLWQFVQDIQIETMLPNNVPMLKLLKLPPVYVITNAAELGAEVSLIQLERSLQQGLKLVQLRERVMAQNELQVFAENIVSLAHRYGAKVLINKDVKLLSEVNADGVHLSSSQLMSLHSRPDVSWCGASCHNAEELFYAEQLGLDFVTLGPVLPTLSHPNSATLGWQRFAKLIRDYALPVYALGGLHQEDLATAFEHGSHGIAMMRGTI